MKNTSIFLKVISIILALTMSSAYAAVQAKAARGGAFSDMPLRSTGAPLSQQPDDPLPPPPPTPPAGMTITQTLSDGAQQNTIAFDGLAFLTGSLGADSFFPPGKVADFWGFQYLRDNDPSQMGHNPLFLTSAAFNMWNVLTTDQRAQLLTLSNHQVSAINDYAYGRFVLMKAFRRLLMGDVPAGSPGLDESAVKAYSAQLYELDGELSYERAQVYGPILASLTPSQTAFLHDNMVGKGMLDWPAVSDPPDMQGLDRDVKEALMTYAGDMYAWYAGSIDADVYFCPERQGTYFGSFYLKDTPVMSTGGSIDTNLTANAGITFLLTLSPTQAALVTGVVTTEMPSLYQIVDARHDIATQLRGFIAGDAVSSTQVLSASRSYGELDGEIIYDLATTFAAVSETLSSQQFASLEALRKQILGDFNLIPEPGAYLYSDPTAMPAITNTDFMFLPPWKSNVFLPMVILSSRKEIGVWTLLKLPDTGQVTDYSPIYGEDSDYTINPPTYTDNGNGSVSDQVTGLVWQQTDGGEMTYANALTYCQNLILASYTDWRLPSSQELMSIVNHDANRPALNATYFLATDAEYWWTAQETVGDSSRAWVVNAGGGIGAHPKNETISAGGSKSFHARCVRNVPVSQAIAFAANGDGTVTHANTELVWQQSEVTPTLTWEAALTYCESLSLGNQNDWRLPNIKELLSISDETRVNPAIDTAYFPGAKSAPYWTSATLFGRKGFAWNVDFSSGLASYNDKTGSLAVRCVRGG